MTPPTPVTELLLAVRRGDAIARRQLWEQIYHELHGIASAQMRREPPGRTLQPTALVNEAYLRLMGTDGASLETRRNFFSAAANVMREIRVDDARNRQRLKRGGGRRRVQLGLGYNTLPMAERDSSGGSGQSGHGAIRYAMPAAFDQDPLEVLAVDEALAKLKQRSPRQHDVVVMRYFGGLTVAETAEAMGCSPRTVDNVWRMARAWLHRELADPPTTSA